MSNDTQNDSLREQLNQLRDFLMYSGPSENDANDVTDAMWRAIKQYGYEQRIDELDVQLPKTIGYDVLWANPAIHQDVTARIESLERLKKSGDGSA